MSTAARQCCVRNAFFTDASARCGIQASLPGFYVANGSSAKAAADPRRELSLLGRIGSAWQPGLQEVGRAQGGAMLRAEAPLRPRALLRAGAMAANPGARRGRAPDAGPDA